jgi:hypothetical protein
MLIISTNEIERAKTFSHVFSPLPTRLRKAVLNKNKPPSPLKPPTPKGEFELVSFILLPPAPKGELGLVSSILFILIILKFKTIDAFIIPL